MRTGTRYRILILLTALSLAVWGIGMGLLPETVPVHWNFAGEADRFGSKLEFLIFPAIEVVMGGIFVFAARQCGKKGGETAALTEQILFWTGVFEVVLFSGIGLYVMWEAGTYSQGEALTASKVLFAAANAPGIWVGLQPYFNSNSCILFSVICFYCRARSRKRPSPSRRRGNRAKFYFLR